MAKRAWNPSDELSYLKKMETRTNASMLVAARKQGRQAAPHGQGRSLQQQAQAILMEIQRIDGKINKIFANPLGNENRIAKLQKRKTRLIERFKQIAFELQQRGEALSGTWLVRKRLNEEYREGY